MAKRVQDLATFVEDEYGGRAERVWTDAKDGMSHESLRLGTRMAASAGVADAATDAGAEMTPATAAAMIDVNASRGSLAQK